MLSDALKVPIRRNHLTRIALMGYKERFYELCTFNSKQKELPCKKRELDKEKIKNIFIFKWIYQKVYGDERKFIFELFAYLRHFWFWYVSLQQTHVLQNHHWKFKF